MSLTDLLVRNSKPKDKQYKLGDSGGLYLLVTPSGGKYWRCKYRVSGKEKLLAIGVYPVITLAEAREKCLQAKRLLALRIDPSQVKKEEKIKQQINSENSFEKVADEWHHNQKLSWTPRHAEYVARRLKANILPNLGSRPINEITAPELLSTLRIIEAREAYDVAHRMLQTCGQIFRYAIATGRAERDVTTDLRGALKTRKVENYKRLEARELPEFMQRLEEYVGELQTKLGLKLLILTFVRTGELRGARWSEIDLIKNEWRIPAERMKMRDPHIVPLSNQAIIILKQLQSMNGHREHVFPNRFRPLTFISENTLIYAIYRMGYQNQATAHGFRATASTTLNEHGFRPDVIERQLAHAERNKVRASVLPPYNDARIKLAV